ncbi:hypothetical protein [Limnovirga soli]|uniref:Uncharacterized protein n=1 Tax=Limnovirga soli TaxID=2656915 RepID=A0A8J8JTN6_9BACT|nr:hypothetical protein [Limnovirga soli]NNV55385.1 hypothetical protein [Limnovirga soli]
MKKILLFLIVSMVFTQLQAQLQNTIWRSTLMIGGPVNVLFSFKNDTASMYTISDSSLIELMTCQIKDSSITLQKIDGQSDCNSSTAAIYHYTIQDKVLHINAITDNCFDRSSVLDATEWQPWQIPVAVLLGADALQPYAGIYQMDAAHPITVEIKNGILYATGPNNALPTSPLMPMGNNKFFLRIAGVEWEFIQDAAGKVIRLISHEQKDYTLLKVK